MKGKLQGDGEEGPLLKPGCVLSVCGSEGGQPGTHAHKTRTPRSALQHVNFHASLRSLVCRNSQSSARCLQFAWCLSVCAPLGLTLAGRLILTGLQS